MSDRVEDPKPVQIAPDKPPASIEPKADLIVGVTGSGKTNNIGKVARWVIERYGKLSRVCSTDPGGAGTLQGQIDAGELEFWPVHAWPNPIEAMYKSTLGHWPLRVDDPESPIVAPDAGTWEVYGYGAFEGLTSYGDAILDDLSGKQASLSQDPSYTFKQGEFSASGENQSYYGFTQKVLKRWVNNTHLLRYELINWTALETRGQDEDKQWMMGPMIAGKKATPKAGSWFCNFVHLDLIAGDVKVDTKTGQKLVETKHVLFLKAHIDPTSLIPFPAKIRVLSDYDAEVPFYLESGNIVEMYVLIEKIREKERLAAAERVGKVAGLKEKLLERAVEAQKRERENAEKRAKLTGQIKTAIPGVGTGAPGVVVVGRRSGGVVVAGGTGSASGATESVTAAPSPAPSPTSTSLTLPEPPAIPEIQKVKRG